MYFIAILNDYTNGVPITLIGTYVQSNGVEGALVVITYSNLLCSHKKYIPMKLKFFELSLYSISNIFNMISSDNVSMHHVALTNWVLGCLRDRVPCYPSLYLYAISALFQKHSLLIESLYRHH